MRTLNWDEPRYRGTLSVGKERRFWEEGTVTTRTLTNILKFCIPIIYVVG